MQESINEPDIAGRDIDPRREQQRGWISGVPIQSGNIEDDDYAVEGTSLVKGKHTPEELQRFKDQGCLIVREAWGCIAYPPKTATE